MSKYYIYRHVREDLQQPFYIGMGTVKNKNAVKPTYVYSRAFSKKNRNRIWMGIVSKTNYTVDILWDTDDKEEVFKKEVEFIKLYGRKDNGTGILSNLTDGGEGGSNPSKEAIRKMVLKNKANGLYEKIGALRRGKSYPNSFKGKERPNGDPSLKECFIYNSNGSFHGKFSSRRDAAKALGITKDCLVEAIRKQKVMRSGKVGFNEYKGAKIHPPINKRCKTVYKICPKSGDVLQKFISSTESMNYIGVGSNIMCQIIKDKRIHSGYIWSFKDKVTLSEYKPTKTVSPKGIRKTTCSKCGQEKYGKMVKYSYCNKCAADRMRIIKSNKK